MPDAEPPAVPPGAGVYGTVRVAGMDVALPLAALREVVPCPAELAALPAAAAGLVGAISLRSTVLPVADLQLILGGPPPTRANPVVVVIAHSGRALGLLADDVCDVTDVPEAALLPVRAEGGELLFSHTFLHPATGRATSLLDAAGLVRQPGLPTVLDVTRSAAADGTGGARGRPREVGRTFTLLRCGSYTLALDVAQVHTTLPSPATHSSVLAGALCAGVTSFAARDVPVVDPLQLLGLGCLPADAVGAGVVLDLGTGYVVLAVSELLELTVLADTDVLPVPRFAVARPELLAGAAQHATGLCLVLDGAALLADPSLLALAAVNTSTDGGSPVSSTAPGNQLDSRARTGDGRPYLTYSIGVDVATPLDQVAEIIPFPAALVPTADRSGVLGLVAHRGTAVPVLCLAALMGLPALQVSAASCLLLIGGGPPVAFAVTRLDSIDPLTWEDAEQRVARSSGAEPSLRRAPLVQVGEAARLLPDLDLRALAAAVLGTPVEEPAGTSPAGIPAARSGRELTPA